MNPLAQAIQETQQENHARLVSPKPCALMISFYHTKYIDEVKEQLAPIVGEFQCVRNRLVRICDSGDEARDMAGKINALVKKVDNILLSAPFEQDWLESYFAIQGYGIKEVFPQYEIQSLEAVKPFLNKRETAEANDIEAAYYNDCYKAAKSTVLTEDQESIISNWADFIYANWVTKLSRGEIYSMFNGAYNAIAKAAKGRDFLNSGSAYRTHSAVMTKSVLMSIDSERSSDKADTSHIDLHPYQHSSQRKVIDQAVAQYFQNDAEELFDVLKSACESYFLLWAEAYPDPFSVEDHNLSTSFNGTDFLFDAYEPPEVALGRSSVELAYINRDELGEPLSKLVSAFTLYIQCYARMKQTALFNDGLTSMAKHLDTKPYHSCILELLENTRPFK